MGLGRGGEPQELGAPPRGCLPSAERAQTLLLLAGAARLSAAATARRAVRRRHPRRTPPWLHAEAPASRGASAWRAHAHPGRDLLYCRT
eukprot:scaffold1440_cov377-Prasinococcus_capsulatus_cf.AAC.5